MGVAAIAIIVIIGMAIPVFSIVPPLSPRATTASPATTIASSSTATASAVSTASPAASDVSAASAATPRAAYLPASGGGPHPGTLEIYEVAPGGATTEDPAVAYDTVSYEPLLNVYQPLITYNGTSNTSYVPVLATCVPGTSQCTKDYGTTLIYDQSGAQYTGLAGQEPIWWTFVIDPGARYYDPSTHASWGVYPTDVMFSEAREFAWASIIGVGSTAGWLTAQAMLPNGSGTWDGGLHYPYNNTPADILGSMLINDSAYCPAAAMTNAHGCITFDANGGASDWPFFIQLIDDGFAGAIVPCGWYTYEDAGIPGWNGTGAAHGDGPCYVKQLGASQSTSSSTWQTYLANLKAHQATSWDSYEELLASTYPAPDPKIQWNAVGSGPYYASFSPTSSPPGYTLHANPDYAQPAGCSGAGGLATYTGYCDPAPGDYIPNVDVYYEPNDNVGIHEYQAGEADLATILPPETAELLELKSEGKLTYFTAPSISDFFLPINLNWSSASYSSDSLPTPGPNVPGNFFSGQAARSLMVESYPYSESETTAWTIDGVKYLYQAGGPIAKGMGGFYPGNVSFPYEQNGGNGAGYPATNPDYVGGAAWWWAQGTDPTSPYYDPELAACVKTTCVFPITGELGNPGLDTAISEFINNVEIATDDHVQPSTFDLPFGGPGSIISDQLVVPPGSGPLPFYNLGWAPDNFDPQDYMLPMAFPNSTYTYSDAVAEQFELPAYDNATACGHATQNVYANLVYWAHQGELSTECQGVAYFVANWWNVAATHVANLAQRTLDYNLIEHVLNALALYVWYGQANEVASAAPWINNATINRNPAVGGGGDNYWFQIQYASNTYGVTFSEPAHGLTAGTTWSVTLGTTTESAVAPADIVFSSVPAGTYPYEVGFVHGYNVTPESGSLPVTAATTVDVTFTAIATTHTYTVRFDESGLLADTPWTVDLAGVGTASSTYPNVTFGLPNGSYDWKVVPEAGYINTTNSSFKLAGAGLTIDVVFQSILVPVYDLNFTEQGLPANTNWTVDLTSTTGSFSQTSNRSTITFGEYGGTYTAAYSTKAAGYTVAVASSTIDLTGNTTVTVPITKSTQAFRLGFTETGLLAGMAWNITLTAYNLTVSSTKGGLNFTLPNGSYAWALEKIPGWIGTPHAGAQAVNGAAVSVAISFRQAVFEATFYEGGLPALSTWYVNLTVDGTKQSISTTGTGQSIALPNGTYTFTVGEPKGWQVETSPLTIVIDGSANYTVIVFGPVVVPPTTYTVTFTWTGGPSGGGWTVWFDGTSKSGAGNLVFTGVANGSYTYSVASIAGYTDTPNGGTVTVDGKAQSVPIVFAATPSTSPSASYLSTLAKEIIGGLAALVVLLLIVAAVIASRRPPAAPPPKGWSDAEEKTEESPGTSDSTSGSGDQT